MDELYDQLLELGLEEYFDILTANGFDSWETLSTITETDMERLDFKRGHRRLLQRKIADAQGHPPDEPLPGASAGEPSANAGGENDSADQNGGASNGMQQHETILPSIEDNGTRSPQHGGGDATETSDKPS